MLKKLLFASFTVMALTFVIYIASAYNPVSNPGSEKATIETRQGEKPKKCGDKKKKDCCKKRSEKKCKHKKKKACCAEKKKSESCGARSDKQDKKN